MPTVGSTSKTSNLILKSGGRKRGRCSLPEATPEELIERWQEFLRESELLPRVMALADAYPEERALELDFAVVDRFDADLGLTLLEKPLAALYAAEEAIKRSIPPSDEPIALRLRVKGLPRDSRVEIRDLRSKHLGKFISLSGLVRKVTEVRPRVVEALFQCLRCNAVIKEEQEGQSFREPLECYKDEGGCGRSAGATKFVLLTENSRYVDTQKIEIQEAPEGLRGGEQPQRLAAYLDDDLTGKITPGARVILNGVLRSVQKGRAPAKSTLFDLFLDVDSLELQQVEFEEIEVSPEDVAKIKKEAEDPEVFTKIVGSIAPSIFGLGTEKEALALQLFGGVPKVMPDGRRIRGDEHILLIGDPGTGKSELLAYMSRLSPRGIYASGQAASGPGLTAAAVRDEFGEGRWTLEAGAMVLADKGLACLHPDSEVFVDGTPTAVGNLFDEQRAVQATAGGRSIEISPLNRPTVSLDLGDLRARESNATFVTRRWYSGPILRATLDSGCQLRLTPDHLVLDGRTLGWRQLQEFRPGDKAVAIQKLPSRHAPILILELLPADWFVQMDEQEWSDFKGSLRRKYGNLLMAGRRFDVHHEVLWRQSGLSVGKFRQILLDLGLYDAWKARCFSFGKNGAIEKLRVGSITPELSYILGFIYGDGYVWTSKGKSYVSIFQSRAHLGLIQKILLTTKYVTSRPWGMQQRSTESTIRGATVKCTGYQMERGSLVLAFLYHWMTGNDLENLLRLDDEVLKGFLAGLMDSDGCISIKSCTKKGVRYETVDIEFLVSKSRRANLRLMYALRRFDVFSRLRRGVGVLRVQVTSRADSQRLLDAISGYSKKWKPLPPRRRGISARHEEVPGLRAKEILEQVHPYTPKLNASGLSSTFYDYLHLARPVRKDPLGALTEALSEWLSPAQRKALTSLAGRDYALDSITKIEAEAYEGYVYDLRVPEGENYSCLGIIIHNCIDEIEKMNPQDRSSIHEILEQQRLSVAKAGITATLQARCALLAAANPKFGRFDEHKYISEQIDLPVTLLSRFDAIFPILDRPESSRDRAMADHILKAHLVGEMRRKQEEQEPSLAIDPNLARPFEPHFPPEFLRKYVAYAKRVYPIMTPDAMKVITDKYLEIRRQGEMEGAAVPITPRQLEAFVRMSEASARARLSPLVAAEDAERSVRIVEYWLQKVTGIEGRFDIDIVATGVSTSQREQIIILRDIIQELAGAEGTADLGDIVERAEQRGIPAAKVEQYLKRWQQEGEVYSPARNKYRLITRS